MFDKKIKNQILNLVSANRETPLPFNAGNSPVPVSGKVIGNRERLLMVEAALDGWLTTGRFNEQFEKKLATFLEAKHVLTVNSGSSANLVALSVFTSPQWGERAIAPGDEVLTVAAGFPTTIAPILQVGAIPVFVDVRQQTWNVDYENLEASISPKCKAVILAHTLGIPYDADRIASICAKYGLWFIEDCCDALGAICHDKKVGSFGHIATLSFYPAHHITTGEGGAIFTNNAKIARIATSFRDWGRHCHCAPGQDNACGHRFDGQYGDLPEGYDHKYVYSHAGYNLKMTDLTAACGLAQMERLESFIQVRRDNYKYLSDKLQNIPYLEFIEPEENTLPSWFGLPLIIKEDAPVTRLMLLQKLNKSKIGTRLLFAGNASRQPFMKNKDYRATNNLLNTNRIMQQGFWLGVWPGLNHEMLDYVATCMKNILD